MVKFLFIFLLLTTTLVSCTNIVEDVNKQMRKKFDPDLSKSLDPFVSTISFYAYAVPENYWYSEETTYREIIDDEFRQGYRGLEKLDDKISLITTNNSEIVECVNNLHEKIKETKKALKEARQSLQQLNGVFGLGLYGGVNTLLDFAQLFGDKNSHEDESTKMPKDVKIAFDRLIQTIERDDYQFCSDLRKFETDAIGTHKLNEEQLKQIRANTKEIVTEQIKQHYIDADTICRNKMTKMLLNTYDESFPIGSNYAPTNIKGSEPSNTLDKKEPGNDNQDNETDRSSIQADFDAIAAKLDQLASAKPSDNETLLKDQADIAVLQKMIRKTLNDRDAASEDLKKAKEMIIDLNDKTKEYQADMATAEMKNK